VKAEDEKQAATRKSKVMAVISGVLVLVLMISIGGNTATTLAMLEVSKEANVRDANLLVKGSSNIVQTAPAEAAVPLFVAPVIDETVLFNVKHLVVSYADGALNAVEPVKVGLQVSRVTKVNDTFVLFHTPDPAVYVQVLNGLSVLVQGGNVAEVCAADVACSAFRIFDDSDANVEDLAREANEALVLAGHEAVEYDGDRRMLRGKAKVSGKVAREPRGAKPAKDSAKDCKESRIYRSKPTATRMFDIQEFARDKTGGNEKDGKGNGDGLCEEMDKHTGLVTTVACPPPPPEPDYSGCEWRPDGWLCPPPSPPANCIWKADPNHEDGGYWICPPPSPPPPMEENNDEPDPNKHNNPPPSPPPYSGPNPGYCHPWGQACWSATACRNFDDPTMWSAGVTVYPDWDIQHTDGSPPTPPSDDACCVDIDHAVSAYWNTYEKVQWLCVCAQLTGSMNNGNLFAPQCEVGGDWHYDAHDWSTSIGR
jgi:hypothetical protein